MPDEQGPMPLAASIVGRWHYDETMINMGVVPFRHRATPEIYHPFDHEVSADPTKNQSMRVSTNGGHGKIPLKWGPRDFRMFPCKPSLAGFRWGCPIDGKPQIWCFTKGAPVGSSQLSGCKAGIHLSCVLQRICAVSV